MSKETTDVLAAPSNHAITTPFYFKPLQSALHERISERADEKFLARGSIHGFDHQDWADAEKELSPGGRVITRK